MLFIIVFLIATYLMVNKDEYIMSNITIQIKPSKTIVCLFNLDSCRDVHTHNAFKTKIA